MIAVHHPHRSFWFYVFEAAYGLLQGGAAKLQAVRIAKNLPILHFWWAAGMVLIAIVCAIAYKRLTHSEWKDALRLFIALMLVRFEVFSPWLNKLRHLKFFYTGKGSLEDRMLGTAFKYVWFTGLIALLAIQIL